MQFNIQSILKMLKKGEKEIRAKVLRCYFSQKWFSFLWIFNKILI